MRSGGKTAPVYLRATYRGGAAQCREAGTQRVCGSQCCAPRSPLYMHSVLWPPYLQQTCGCFIAAAIKERGPQGWLVLALSKDILRLPQRQQSNRPLQRRLWCPSATRGLVFSAYSAIPLSAPEGLFFERKQPARQSFTKRHLVGHDLLGLCSGVSGI